MKNLTFNTQMIEYEGKSSTPSSRRKELLIEIGIVVLVIGLVVFCIEVMGW